MIICSKDNTGWSKSRLTVFGMEDNTIINNPRINSCALHIHNYNPTVTPPCVLTFHQNEVQGRV